MLDVDAPWDDSSRVPRRICQGNNRYVPELIRLSRDVHAPEAGDPLRTPLWMAVVSCSDLAVGALLACGADPSTPASHGQPLLDLARNAQKMKKHKNLRGQVDRIVTMLETGGAWPQATCSA